MAMKVVDIVGARPQFVKLAPILKAVEQHNQNHSDRSIQEVLVHTGQHYDYVMSQVFFDEFKLKSPDYHLGVGSGSHAYQTGEVLRRFEEILVREKPDLVMVYGDTNATLSGALAAAKLHIPVAHVEAGLRSFNRKMPEEVNRVLADHISTLLFCPTKTAVINLRREGLTRNIGGGELTPYPYSSPLNVSCSPDMPMAVNTGDVMYDSVLLYSGLAEKSSQVMDRLGLSARGYALATVHRAENTDDPLRLRSIFEGLQDIAAQGLAVVVPLHPRTKKALSQSQDLQALCPSLSIIDPVSYLDMIMLEKNAQVILTDSGGVQKEAFFFRVPCVTLREETEWVETVETRWNVLAGSDRQKIARAAQHARPGVKAAWPYGDGRTAERIIEFMTLSFEAGFQ
jgi:UDP-N-acetylglucosamine 2-epimerase